VQRFSLTLLTFASLVLANITTTHAAAKPNVVLVMTDDQGYGDLRCLGNKIIRTPNLDKLYAESVRLTNYHVDPTCSPTRSALMTGRYSSRTGVWHTIMGRSMMATDELTVAEVFAANNYKTGFFGKWHLGDNYPLRPQDQGFQHVLMNGGGGVTQTPDYWDNDYFDDSYFRNGKPEKFKGYCTDIWFDNAMKFIEANREKPFFVYIPTNAPHGPFNVAAKYSDVYRKQGVPDAQAKFWGMITNIDENVARLRKKLDALKLSDNTIFIFTTDNGTAAGARGPKGFNAGMRGQKGSEYDGGHRVPFFVHWPSGGLTGGRDVNQLAAHVDVLPTLGELCELELPSGGHPIDGMSLAPLLRSKNIDVPDRTILVHSQRIEKPVKWRKSAVMTNRWRFVNGKELYDMSVDPGQKTNVADKHPKVVKQLTGSYETWWKSIDTRFNDYVRISLGSKEESPAQLTCHDWHTNNGPVPWNHGHIRRDIKANGFWAVDVAATGKYTVTLRTRPAHVKHPLNPGVARVKIGNVESAAEIAEGATSVTLTVNLKKGPARMQTWFEEANDKTRGAYFVDVELIK
jgi:arylsulfatase A-like enzyme